MAKLTKRQFSLKALMAAIFVVSLVVATFPSVGHYLVFGAAALTAMACVSKSLRRTMTLTNRFAWITLSMISVLVSFVLSIGPASWFLARYNTRDYPRPRTCALYHRTYQPIATLIIYSPPLLRRAGIWYIANGMPSGTRFHNDWPRGMGWTTTSLSDPSQAMTFTVVNY